MAIDNDHNCECSTCGLRYEVATAARVFCQEIEEDDPNLPAVELKRLNDALDKLYGPDD